jgi:anti-sigma factor RsiW
MNITQDIVTDLLPAYLSGEASRDTQALVEDFMNGNPQFAAVVHAARRGLSEPVLPDQRAMAADLERESVNRTRAVIRSQGRLLAFAVVFTLMPLSFSFGPGGIQFLLRDQPVAAVFWLPAASLWFTYLRTRTRLRSAGL